MSCAIICMGDGNFASLAGAGQHNSHSRVTPTISGGRRSRGRGEVDAVLTLQDLAARIGDAAQHAQRQRVATAPYRC